MCFSIHVTWFCYQFCATSVFHQRASILFWFQSAIFIYHVFIFDWPIRFCQQYLIGFFLTQFMFVFIQHIPLLVLYGGFSLTHMVFSCFLYDMFRHFGLYVLMSDNLCHNSGKVLRYFFRFQFYLFTCTYSNCFRDHIFCVVQLNQPICKYIHIAVFKLMHLFLKHSVWYLFLAITQGCHAFCGTVPNGPASSIVSINI